MPIGVTRRDLFRRSSTDGPRILPPWAHPRGVFANLCDGCAQCVSACPQNIIEIDRNNLAFVNFQKGFCDFCEECEMACPSKALNKQENPAWSHFAKIDAKCLSVKGTVCRLCEENCEAQAIRFRPAMNGRSIPFVDMNKCDGCGGCQAVCPTEAVHFIQPQKEPQS